MGGQAGTEAEGDAVSGPAEAAGSPAAEVVVDSSKVRALLQEQHPDLSHLPLQDVGHGYDTFIYRLGHDLAVRLPRRDASVACMRNELTWLRAVAGALPVATPVPVRSGQPSALFPWPWSVVRWLPGSPADHGAPAPGEAQRLGACLRTLHRTAPADAPRNPWRGAALTVRAAEIDARIARLSQTTESITAAVRDAWAAALAAPIDTPSTWMHGDLHPGNILVEHGRLTGIIDWGDLCAGDAAGDLAAPWMLFDTIDARLDVLAGYGGVTAATLARARGWAVFFGTILLEHGLAGNPRHAAIGAATLRRIAADAEP